MDSMHYWAIPGIHENYRRDVSPVLNEETILTAVCRHFSVKPIDLKTKYRGTDVVLPRQIAMFLMVKHAKYSLHKVGEFFGRDHSTVHYARKHITDLLENEHELRLTISKIEESFYGKSTSIKDCLFRRRKS